ncbi:MAG: CAP family protein [Bacteroidota bacterium]
MKFLALMVTCISLYVQNYGQELMVIDTATRSSILKEHNKERQLLNIPDLVWSDELAEYAAEWALQLAEEDDGIHHRDPDEFGENISWFSDAPDEFSSGVSLWNEEKKYFKYKAIGNDWAKSGHYTQVIWKNTERVGCGCALGASGTFFFVCNYDPPGNYMGQRPY